MRNDEYAATQQGERGNPWPLLAVLTVASVVLGAVVLLVMPVVGTLKWLSPALVIVFLAVVFFTRKWRISTSPGNQGRS